MWEVLAQLCFDPQNEQQIKNKENESSLRWVALSDPPWACLRKKDLGWDRGVESKKAVQHVYLVGAKSMGAYGGYETFVYKLTEYHQKIVL